MIALGCLAWGLVGGVVIERWAVPALARELRAQRAAARRRAR